MNQNTTPQSGGAAARGARVQQGAPAGGASTAAGNPYAERYQQASHPDLDAAAPELKSSDMRRLNRRALVFLLCLVALMVIAAVWMFNSVLRRSEAPKKVREEVVTVPAAPKLPPLLPPEPPKAEPIPLAMQPATPPQTSMPPVPQVQGPRLPPSLLERRMMSGNVAVVGIDNGAMTTSFMPGMQAPGGMPNMGGMDQGGIPSNTAYPGKPLVPTSSAQPLVNPDTLMLRGTYIRCVLETHIVTDIPGFTSCIVTEPIYSFNGKRLLLPKGSKVLGKYETEPNGDRVAVIWDRVVTPTGIDVNMESPGIDKLGGAGHPGYRDEHWGTRIGAAMMISLLSDAFKYAAANSGPSSTTVTTSGLAVQSPYESNTAQTLQDISRQAVRRAANRPATVTIHQGTVVNVYVAKDVDFSGVVARY